MKKRIGLFFSMLILAVLPGRMMAQTDSCAITSLPVFWDFENCNTSIDSLIYGFPCGWSIIPPTQVNSFSPHVYELAKFAHSGTKAMRFFCSWGSYLVLPPLCDTLDANQLSLSFYAKINEDWSTLATLEIGVMTDSSDASTFTAVYTLAGLDSLYHPVDINLSSYTGTGKYIAFHDNTYGALPNISIDDLTLDWIPVCQRPSIPTVTNVESRSANITWTHYADSTEYVVFYRSVYDSIWHTDTVTTTSLTLINLIPSSTYELYVKAMCSPGMPSETVTFTTECAADIISVPQTWDFEEATVYDMEPCWNRIRIGNYPRVESYHPQSGSQSLCFYDSYGAIAIMPFVNSDYLDIRDLQVSFYIYNHRAHMYPASCIDVGVMTDPNDASTFTLVQRIDSLQDTYIHVTVPFYMYADSGSYIAFRDPNVYGIPSATSNYYYDIYIDSVTVEYSLFSPCETPTDLQQIIALKEAGSINVTWTDNADVSQWNLQYRSLNGDWTTVVVTGMPEYAIDNLENGEDYEIRVQAVCDDNVSEWSAILIATATNSGLDSWLAASVTLYPNPAREYVDVRVDGDVNVTEMEVYDVYGKAVCTVGGVNSDSPLQTRINVSNLSAGIYFVRVTTDYGTVTKRFVKQ